MRPMTEGFLTSTGPGQLPSDSSYSQPLALTVATTNAQGKLTQPKNGRLYNISAPIPQSELYISDGPIGLPSTHRGSARYSQVSAAREEPKSHKRSNTLSNVFGRSASFFSGKAQAQSPTEQIQPQQEKKYPPTSIKRPITSSSPRQSTESRRPSFGFSRKNSDVNKADKPHRFSLLPASFSLKNLGGGSKDPGYEGQRPMLKRQSSYGQQPDFQAIPYGKGLSNPNSDESVPIYDGGRDPIRNASAPLDRRTNVPPRTTGRSEPFQPSSYTSPHYAPQPASAQNRTLPLGQSYFIPDSGAPTESDVSVNQTQAGPRYPPGFDGYDDDRRPSMQQGRNGRGASVLQKPHRKFADAYEQDAGHHAGSSGAAKRVMDFFR